MRIKEYNRDKAVEYAKKWAYKRNPSYYNFDYVGGDCTSFVSQCLLAGGAIMNRNINGWFYRNGYNKSASWSGVEFLYKFLITNKFLGPYGKDVDFEKISKGDLIQLSFDGEKFSHSLIIIDKDYQTAYVATHSDDSYYRDLYTYTFKKVRFIKIEGIRIL